MKQTKTVVPENHQFKYRDMLMLKAVSAQNGKEKKRKKTGCNWDMELPNYIKNIRLLWNFRIIREKTLGKKSAVS